MGILQGYLRFQVVVVVAVAMAAGAPSYSRLQGTV